LIFRTGGHIRGALIGPDKTEPYLIDFQRRYDMKRILILGTLACTLVMGHASWSSLADKKESAKAAKWEQVTFKLDKGKEESAMVLRIWDSAAADPKWPQLALLRLSPAAYKELRKNSTALKAFIDGTQTGKLIFDAPVTITEGCKLPKPEDEKSAEEVSWLLTISHRTSHVSCSALRERAIGY
jgi:hypothetical protein